MKIFLHVLKLGKNSILRKKPFFSASPVTVFYSLYTGIQCLLYESSRNRAKTSRALVIFSLAGSAEAGERWACGMGGPTVGT